MIYICMMRAPYSDGWLTLGRRGACSSAILCKFAKINHFELQAIYATSSENFPYFFVALLRDAIPGKGWERPIHRLDSTVACVCGFAQAHETLKSSIRMDKAG
jgi:hypothetical protein